MEDSAWNYGEAFGNVVATLTCAEVAALVGSDDDDAQASAVPVALRLGLQRVGQAHSVLTLLGKDVADCDAKALCKFVFSALLRLLRDEDPLNRRGRNDARSPSPTESPTAATGGVNAAAAVRRGTVVAAGTAGDAEQQWQQQGSGAGSGGGGTTSMLQRFLAAIEAAGKDEFFPLPSAVASAPRVPSPVV